MESHDPWHRPATETKIFRIPVASLIMYTMQRRMFCALPLHLFLFFHTIPLLCVPVRPTIYQLTTFVVSSDEVEFYFLTEFTDSIWVSLNIGLYGYLREIATLYQCNIITVSPMWIFVTSVKIFTCSGRWRKGPRVCDQLYPNPPHYALQGLPALYIQPLIFCNFGY